jgi:predicted nucleotidyltransferase
MERRAIERQLREFFREHSHDAVAVYLFGSVARGTAGSRSDVDVAVLFARPCPSRLSAQPFALEDDLRARLGRPVQVVVLDAAPPDLAFRVLRDGVLVLDREPNARAHFEVRVRNEYFDIKPFLDRYRRTDDRPRPDREETGVH